MVARDDVGRILHRIPEESHGEVLDAFGPTVEILAYDDKTGLCTIRGVIPHGVTVPLHSHDDPEDFYVVAGSHQVLTEGENGLEWSEARAGDYVRVPPGTLHAHRNVSGTPAVDLIVTTAQMGRFFREIGRPFTGTPQPPAPEDLARFVAVAQKYGYRLGTPAENAAVGIEMPGIHP
jgi:quercetin dioxygenase-like cupin family protein